MRCPPKVRSLVNYDVQRIQNIRKSAVLTLIHKIGEHRVLDNCRRSAWKTGSWSVCHFFKQHFFSFAPSAVWVLNQSLQWYSKFGLLFLHRKVKSLITQRELVFSVFAKHLIVLIISFFSPLMSFVGLNHVFGTAVTIPLTNNCHYSFHQQSFYFGDENKTITK